MSEPLLPERFTAPVCQKCGQAALSLKDLTSTIAWARFTGWIIYEGLSMSGKDIKVCWCGPCQGSPRPPKPGPVLDGQLGLFGEEEA